MYFVFGSKNTEDVNESSTGVRALMGVNHPPAAGGMIPCVS